MLLYFCFRGKLRKSVFCNLK